MNQFSFNASKDNVRIYWHDQLVKILSGAKAIDFLNEIDQLSEDETQLLLAKMTGNFRRGNEKMAKKSRRNR